MKVLCFVDVIDKQHLNQPNFILRFQDRILNVYLNIISLQKYSNDIVFYKICGTDVSVAVFNQIHVCKYPTSESIQVLSMRKDQNVHTHLRWLPAQSCKRSPHFLGRRSGTCQKHTVSDMCGTGPPATPGGGAALSAVPVTPRVPSPAWLTCLIRRLVRNPFNKTLKTCTS